MATCLEKSPSSDVQRVFDCLEQQYKLNPWESMILLNARLRSSIVHNDVPDLEARAFSILNFWLSIANKSNRSRTNFDIVECMRIICKNAAFEKKLVALIHDPAKKFTDENCAAVLEMCKPKECHDDTSPLDSISNDVLHALIRRTSRVNSTPDSGTATAVVIDPTLGDS